ncbi:nuclear transport factor 2 family protein [Companilactobacillus ginsenosidimutans]|uniref:Ketosteroid isomerase n=1 Tax=Companilactobacillus ginsenosidimutans TaxID=1007676 RepID=A0A0H4QL95_9LACO|nr:nuclear transport factor 2 family protein [Companilactobacillus ginsenosidimutans]AKP67478.1 ketosteroid isomerase [Companilactobacillus ginsenosidimutans]
MTENNLPEAIKNFVSYTNSADSEKFVSLFTPNAVLNDWGTEYHTPKEIAKWNQTDNIGKNSQFEIVDSKEDGTNQWIVTLKVSGNGFNGVSPFKMIVKDNKLESVQILPD